MSPYPQQTPPKKGGGALLGCGGAGCGVGVLLAIAGAILLVFGLDPKTDEAMPFAMITLSLSSLVGFVGLVLLIVGFVKRSR